MKPQVRDMWRELNEPIEGWCRHMYLCQAGLVTTGLGNMIEPIEYAASLPWVKRNGEPAERNEIEGAFRFVKAQQNSRMRGGGAFEFMTSVRLRDADIATLVTFKLADMERRIRRHFVDWDGLPWQAQMVALSLAWAAGPLTVERFRKFRAAVDAADWQMAADECGLRPDNAWIALRNTKNRELLEELSGTVDVTPDDVA